MDLKIYKDAAGKLATKIFTKPTDRQAYLHKTSAHPNHLKKSIPYGQALRLRRICTEPAEFEKSSRTLKTKLINRGYTEEEITSQINRAREKPREELLKYNTEQRETSQRIPYVVTYYPDLPNLKTAVEKHWPILHINQKMKDTFTHKPIMAYRRNRNLGDILGQKTISNSKVIRKDRSHTIGSCNPCSSGNGSKCCRHMR